MTDRSANNSGLDIIWGIHPVLETLRKNPRLIREIIIEKSKKGGKIQEIIELAKGSNCKIRFTDHLKIPNQKQQINHQGIMARTKPFSTLSLDELLSRCPDTNPTLLALDSIQDPHNLGAIIRTASAAGVTGIIVTKDRTAPLSGTAAKTAAGALAHIDICLVTNLSDTLKKLKDKGFWIYGGAGDADRTIYRTEFSGPICVVIGSEGKGIRSLVKKHCDFLVSIPMQSSLDSLNASVAAGVVLFEIARQRIKREGGN